MPRCPRPGNGWGKRGPGARGEGGAKILTERPRVGGSLAAGPAKTTECRGRIENKRGRKEGVGMGRRRRRENKKFVERGVVGEGEEQTINRTMDTIRESGREFSRRFYI